MEKKNIGLGVAALAAGAGAVALAAKNHKNNVKNEVKKAAANAPEQEYRNTERGKNEKNSKGIYYTNGNYEAFARPKKPQGVDEKSAYIVGSGLASLAAACFLVRDGQMPGDHIHILEAKRKNRGKNNDRYRLYMGGSIGKRAGKNRRLFFRACEKLGE